MDMPDSVKLRWRKNLFDNDELQVHFNSGGIEYHHSRVLKAKDAEIARLEAIIESRGM